jgi:alkylation response protein AidB-like acyl-CoA dehydrogenase
MSGHGYLTDGRLRLQQEARQFALEEVLPLANELDPKREDIPRSFLAELAERGYTGIMISQEHGGLGLGAFEYCLVTEELARGWMSVGSIIGRANGLGCATAEQFQASARGDRFAAFALSEPNAGSDVAGIECRATREGDEWVLNGRKRWCGIAKMADCIVVFARTQDPDPQKRHLGIETFLVEKERDAFPPGLTGEPIDKIGYFGMTTWNLHFDGLRIPGDAMLQTRSTRPQRETSDGASSDGEGEGRGFHRAVTGLNVGRCHTAARAVGLARGALEDSLAYVQQRRQFGRPIGDFQAIRFKLADMAAQVEAARQLWHYAAQKLDDGEVGDREAAMAKLFATEMAVRVTGDALQIHGGNGYTTEHAVERYWRDARLTTIFEGTSEIQRRIISDRLLGRPS